MEHDTICDRTASLLRLTASTFILLFVSSFDLIREAVRVFVLFLPYLNYLFPIPKQNGETQSTKGEYAPSVVRRYTCQQNVHSVVEQNVRLILMRKKTKKQSFFHEKTKQKNTYFFHHQNNYVFYCQQHIRCTTATAAAAVCSSSTDRSWILPPPLPSRCRHSDVQRW